MSFIIETDHSFWLGSSARLLGEGDDKVVAWAEEVVRKDPDLRWILGNYVEADRANSNGHIFPLADLLEAQHTLAHKPLNMLHADQFIVGHFAGARLLTPDGATMTAELVESFKAQEVEVRRPYMEAVAAFYHKSFPEEYLAVKRAHGEGNLFFSMESIPPTVTCPECGLTTAFDGLESETYCDEMQGPIGPKILNQPNFCAGALIIPPVRPGWKRADIKTISELVTANSARAEAGYEAARTVAPHASVNAWEFMMAQLLLQQADSGN